MTNTTEEARVISAAARLFGVQTEALTDKRRRTRARQYVLPIQIIHFILRYKYQARIQRLAAITGLESHATVLNSCKRVIDLCRFNQGDVSAVTRDALRLIEAGTPEEIDNYRESHKWEIMNAFGK